MSERAVDEPRQLEARSAPASRSIVGVTLSRRRNWIAGTLTWAVIGVVALYWLAPNPWRIMPSRAAGLRASVAALNSGGPLLLGYSAGHVPYAVGVSDDDGIYVIVPELSHWLGQSDPISMLRWLWLAAWAFTLVLSAIVFRALFRSNWAALLAPPTLIVCVLSFGFGDIYWVSAWVVVTFMPVLILLARHRPRRGWAALVLIAAVAGIVTTIRSDAGLPIALSTVAVAVMWGRRWLARAVVVAAILVAYLSPAWIALPAIRAHRDHRVGANLSAHSLASHQLWHSAYIGLGYTPNRYGIHYLDSYGEAAVQELHPGTRYLSPTYDSTLHREVDALVTHDPGFVVKAEAQKALVELYHTAPYLLLLALLLPAAMLARGRLRLRRSELALFLPPVAIGALPAIIAVPFRDYELGLLAPLGVLGLLAIGSLAARAEDHWAAVPTAGGLADRVRAALRSLWRSWPSRLTLRTLLVTAVVLIPVALFSRHIEAEHERWDRTERNPPHVLLVSSSADSGQRLNPPHVMFASAPAGSRQRRALLGA